MLRLVNEHGIKPIVDEVTPLAEGARAIARMKDSSQFGKLVLEI